MSIIGRYLAYSHLTAFLAAFSFSILFFLTFKVFSILRLAINKDVSLLVVLELLGRLSLTFVPVVAPLSILFATLYTLSKLSRDSAEFTVMRSIGLGRMKLLLPFLSMAALIGMATFILNDRMIPFSKREFRKTLAILASKGMISDIREGNFFLEIPDMVLFVEKTTDFGKKMEGVFIHTKEKNGSKRAVFAKKGELKKGGESRLGIGQMELILREGSMLVLKEDLSEMEKILFETYRFPLAPGTLSTDFRNKSSMKSSFQLYNEVRSLRGQDRSEASAEEIKDMAKTEIEFYSRINTPFLCLIFALIGFSLGIQRMRGESRGTAGTAIIVLLLYYSLFFAGVSLARNGLVSAPLVVFFPSLFGLGIGIYYFRKLEWIV
ncbi:MAG: LptF/LptG family permease [Bacteriovoracales bacterium]|nr:LptF/LptG family permease [Bacteriovoracales bacterium]